MKKRIIWSNRDIDFEQWKEDYIAYKKEYEDDNCEDISDDDVWDWIHEQLEQHLEDEHMNLDVPTERRIIAIADLELWNGRRQGYKILGWKVNEIFQIGEDYNEYYSDGYNIRATCVHHDGVNRIEYRVMRMDRDPDVLLWKIERGEEITRRQINYYTKSLLPYVRKVYGW